jgi:aspartate racemase
MWSEPANVSHGAEPVIGILGGMGPAATAEFLAKITEFTNAPRDQDHFRCIVLSDTKIPDRSQAIRCGSSAPLLAMKNDTEKLIAWGADILAVPCNTAHVFLNRFVYSLPVTFISIVNSTLSDAMSTSPEGAWLTGTAGTISSGLYQHAAAERGYQLLTPPKAIQSDIDQCIAQVKAGELHAAGLQYKIIAEELLGISERHIITACTELPLAFRESGMDSAIQISSIDALARAVVISAESWRRD